MLIWSQDYKVDYLNSFHIPMHCILSFDSNMLVLYRLQVIEQVEKMLSRIVLLAFVADFPFKGKANNGLKINSFVSIIPQREPLALVSMEESYPQKNRG
jgi:hypothetical protein